MYIDNVVGGVRVEGDAVEQVVVDARGGHGDGLRPAAEVAVTAVGLHLDLIRGVLSQTRDGVAVCGRGCG